MPPLPIVEEPRSMMSFRLAAAFLLATALPLASAQTPAPAAAPASASTAPAAAEKECGKPDPHPGRLASTEKMRGWNKDINTWQECMKKFIGGLQAKADSAVKEANTAVADSNPAIAAYNTTVKELQSQAEAAK